MALSSTLRMRQYDPIYSDDELVVYGVALNEMMEAKLVERESTGDQLLMSWRLPAHAHQSYTQGGEMLHWDAGQAHRYGNLKQEWEHSWIHADGHWLSQCLQRFHIPNQSLFPSTHRWPWLITALYDELTMGRPADGLIIRSLFEVWARDTSLAMQQSNKEPKWLPVLRKWLHHNKHQDISIADCCDIAGVAHSRLCAAFLQAEGMSIGNWLQRIRLQEAAALLSSEEASVTEIGARVGYPNTTYFCRIFRRYYGSSPGSWRAENRL